MGEVYRARDPRLQRTVAIKVLPPSFSADPDRLRRFEHEARAAGSLNHPNIVAIYDVGTHEVSPYLVTEFLEGQTLRDKLLSRLSVERVLDAPRRSPRVSLPRTRRGSCTVTSSPRTSSSRRMGAPRFWTSASPSRPHCTPPTARP